MSHQKPEKVCQFGLNPPQFREFMEWRNSLPPVNEQVVDGGHFTFKFTQTGISTFVEVERKDGHVLKIDNKYYLW